jgi:hypothetical protein
MEILQYGLAIFLGGWSLYYLINRFRPKKNNLTADQSCGTGCGCKPKDDNPS